MIYIRPLDASDVPTMAELWSENRSFLERWMAPKDDYFYTVEGQRQELEYIMQAESVATDVVFAICVDEQIVGLVSIHHIIHGNFSVGTLGYWIAEEFNGRGLATAAISMACDLAFAQLKIHRLRAYIMPVNTGSIVAIERNGFRREGTAKACINIEGVWQDHHVFALTAPEYHAKKLNTL